MSGEEEGRGKEGRWVDTGGGAGVRAFPVGGVYMNESGVWVVYIEDWLHFLGVWDG